MMRFRIDEKYEQQTRVQELTAQVMAAELNLTYFAERYGKTSPIYTESLRDFATAWYLLKKNREQGEFLGDMVAELHD